MIKIIYLRGSGSEVAFRFRIPDGPCIDNMYIDLTVNILSKANTSNYSINSINDFISTDDMLRMVNYIDRYIDSVTNNSGFDLPPFTTYSLIFELLAVDGWVENPDEGEILIQILVNTGENKLSDGFIRNYMGGRVAVSIISYYEFANEIRNFVYDLTGIK